MPNQGTVRNEDDLYGIFIRTEHLKEFDREEFVAKKLSFPGFRLIKPRFDSGGIGLYFSDASVREAGLQIIESELAIPDSKIRIPDLREQVRYPVTAIPLGNMFPQASKKAIQMLRRMEQNSDRGREVTLKEETPLRKESLLLIKFPHSILVRQGKPKDKKRLYSRSERRQEERYLRSEFPNSARIAE